jgi:N6-L-threonylcarbamoyladenine synthase
LQSQFDQFQPSVSLIVSGGHTLLVHVPKLLEHRVIGATLDDAAGECFDKVAKLMGLPYPGGPEIDRLAGKGNPDRFSFPRPMLNEPGFDFSFAGLKTSVRYFLQKNPGLLEKSEDVYDLCASVQKAIVEVLVTKTIRAAAQFKVPVVSASGGVACNSLLRRDLERACLREGLVLRLCQPSLSTDNAGMIGILAEQMFLQNKKSANLDSEIRSSWELN